ncbi:TetR family transcriptional regulator [Murinocardiopsis flavida]|uniref:TetR family transcriptional regulator n=1 Tax=Murinocardiopsis flavida TaxID=645275 RepID=A0A2P8DNL6_9ACTN|nr:TetR family transcriptional regulator [Murinocardiopsis flavida]PSK98815.1 TetR family transcriptional regulator [Murinocardiopsis flavida]
MTKSEEGRGGSFIHTARREQLVECAIEVIAERGLARASMVRIAERAQVSRGVLSYHFRDRAELIEKVVESVYDLGAAVLGPRMAAAGTPRESLLTFVSGSIELYADYPRHMAALTEIFAGEAEDAVPRARHHRHTQEATDLGRILRAGQEQGQFRAFDVEFMCTTIRQALDGALKPIARGERPEKYVAELRATIDAATAAQAAR